MKDRQKKQAGAELCQAQVKLGYPAKWGQAKSLASKFG